VRAPRPPRGRCSAGPRSRSRFSTRAGLGAAGARAARSDDAILAGALEAGLSAGFCGRGASGVSIVSASRSISIGAASLSGAGFCTAGSADGAGAAAWAAGACTLAGAGAATGVIGERRRVPSAARCASSVATVRGCS
jgi:hypothetical protein